MALTNNHSPPPRRRWRVEGEKKRGLFDRAHALSYVMSPFQGLAALCYVALPGLSIRVVTYLTTFFVLPFSLMIEIPLLLAEVRIPLKVNV